jgi:hypothetical protein
LNSGALKADVSPLSVYYLVTPLFILLDWLFSLQIRVALPGESSGLYYAYLGLCFLLGGLVFRQGMAAAFFGLAESTLNILLLGLSVFLPILALADDPSAGFEFGAEKAIQFLVVGSVLIYAFRSSAYRLAAG